MPDFSLKNLCENLKNGESQFIQLGEKSFILQRLTKKKENFAKSYDAENSLIIVRSVAEIEEYFGKIEREIRERLTNIWRADCSTQVQLNFSENENMRFLSPKSQEIIEISEKTDSPIIIMEIDSGEKSKNITKFSDDFFEKELANSRIIKFSRKNEIAEKDKFDGDFRVVEIRSDDKNHPEDLIISRKRKLYKFAKFLESENCFDLKKWTNFREDGFKNVLGDGKIVAEIGAGSAIFITKLAEKYPEKFFVAVDKKSDRLLQGANLAKKLNLKNIFYIWADVSRISQIFREKTVDEIWVTFSDPFARDEYQSKRADFSRFFHDNLRFSDAKNYEENLRKYISEIHEFDEKSRKNFDEYLQKNGRGRLTEKRFLGEYEKIIKNGGKMNFKTDNSPLFEWSMKSFRENDWSSVILTRNLHCENSTDFEDAQIMTSYEERFAKELLPISFVCATKKD